MTLERSSREPGEVLPSGTRLTLPEGTLIIEDHLAQGGSAVTRGGILRRIEQSPKLVGIKIFRNFYLSPSGEPMDPFEPENEATVQLRLMEKGVPHILPQELYIKIKDKSRFEFPEGTTMPDIYIPESGIHVIANMLAVHSLRDVITIGNLQPDEINLSIGNIVEALKRMHDNDVVHGDVTPYNVLLGIDGDWKIGDFGLSIIDPTKQFLEPPFKRRVTRDYSAPELFFGSNIRRRPETDQFSLAVVLYEAATGISPFSQQFYPSLREQVTAILAGPAKLEDIITDDDRRHVVEPYVRAAETGMKPNAEDRYENMGEFEEKFVEASQISRIRARTGRRSFGGETIPE